MSLIEDLIKVNFGVKIPEEHEMLFCEKMGKKLHSFENSLYFKHKQCLEYCNFEKSEDEDKFLSSNKHFPGLEFELGSSYRYEPLEVA